MATRMIQRRGTAAEWTTANPVLAAGEIGFETDTTKFKFGDGTTAWANIPYFASADALIDGAPELLDTLNELAAAIGDDAAFFTTINDKIDSKASIIVQNSIPAYGPGGNPEPPQTGDLWLDTSSLRLYSYFENGEDTPFWVEVGGSIDLDSADLANAVSFPNVKSNGDEHNGYVYDNTRNSWNIKQENLEDADNVVISTLAQDNVLMYNNDDSSWENVAGIRLDENGEIPTSYTAPLQALLEGTLAHMTIQTTAEWATDTSIPASGSLNVETGSGILIKIGNGSDTFADLPYVPTQASLTADIASALADYATKANPTFSGTVSLPSTTSIGDVDATEISHLDGVTSGIQGQLDSLDTLKAPIADPTFTGTVSGVTKSMVGLGSVDNTADADKPVSTATQAALDLKASLSGADFGGNVTIAGNLTVSGETVTVSASDLSVRDNMIYLNQAGQFDLSNAVGDGTNVVYTTSTDHDIKVGDYITVSSANPSSFDISGEGLEVTAVTADTITVLSAVTDTYVDSGTLRGKSHANPDLGWAAGRYDGGYAHAGVFRDASDGVFKFFDGYVPEPDESVFIDTTDASFALAPLAVEKVVFADGTEQSAAGVPSITGFTQVDDEVQVATITNVVGDGNLATITTSADHGFSESDTVVIADVVDASYNGTYTITSTPTSTTFTVTNGSQEDFTSGGTATVTTPGNYTLDTLDHQDNIVEMNSSSAVTFTIPTDAALAWPVGASMDIFAAGTGEVTIAGDTGVTVNATPGLILRTQWSSATILKRGANSWVVYGDLKA